MKSSIFDVIAETEFYIFLFLVFLVYAMFHYLPPGFFGEDVNLISSTAENFWLLLPEYGVAFMNKFFPFSFFFSLILGVVIIWISIQINNIQDKLTNKLKEVNDSSASGSHGSAINEKWEKVIIHINSENQNDWKLAILECDIMLGDLLEKRGYMQLSIGEKLKAVDPKDFSNIESAWEAHKIRNAVAHEGSEFLISHREAKRVIGLYEVVFREFAFI